MSFPSVVSFLDPGLRAELIRLAPAGSIEDLLLVAGVHGGSDALSDEQLLAFLIAESGGELSSAPRLIRRLLEQLPPSELDSLAMSILGKAFAKSMDNAIALSRVGGRDAIEVLQRLGERFGLEKMATPQKHFQPSNVELCFTASQAHVLLEHQRLVVEKSIPMIRRNQPFLVQMPTGSGKTTTAINVLIHSGLATEAFDSGQTVLWLAPSIELLDQAMDTFRAIWARDGKSPAIIVRADGLAPEFTVPEGCMVFLSYQKLASLIAKKRFTHLLGNSGVRAVIADEAHRALAITYERAIDSVSRAYGSLLIGLTATPGRVEEMNQQNRRLADMYSTTIIRSYDGDDEIGRLQAAGILSHVRFARLLSPSEPGAPRLDPRSVAIEDEMIGRATLQRLSSDAGRNKLIVSLVQSAVAAGHRVLVFACSVRHANLLSVALSITGVLNAAISADTPMLRRRDVIRKFRNSELSAILNYNVLSTGFDAPGTDFLVIARPTTSIVTFSQMVGRALRGPVMGGVTDSTVVHVQDFADDPRRVGEIYSFFDGYWNEHLDVEELT